MSDRMATPIQKNRAANIALDASIINIVCWLLLAVPNFIQSSWSVIQVVAIPLSAVTALVAGALGQRKVKIFGTGSWQSGIGIIVGILNIVLIGISLIGIYAMVNLP